MSDRDNFPESISMLAKSVESFHERFQVDAVDFSSDSAALELLRKRLSLLSEESGEFARELNKGNLEHAIHEAVDVAYIALGTILCIGERGLDACKIVINKNDKKSKTGYSKRNSTGKVVSN